MINRAIQYIPVTLVALMVVLLPFAYDERLMHAIQSTKTFWFAGFVMVLINLQLVWKFFFYKTGWSIKPLDIALLVHFAYTLAHPYIFDYSVAPHIWIENLSLGAFYFIIRQFPTKQLPILLVAIMTSCMVQAIYGSLQLYGFYPSNHSLFNITGSFFNPGPFAGFVVMGMPMAVTLYLITKGVSNDKINIIEDPNSKKSLVIDGWSLMIGFIEKKDIRILMKFLKYISPLRLKLNRTKLLNYFAQLVTISILLVLPASRSRAAWVGGVLSLLWVAWIYRKEIKSYLLKQSWLIRYAHFIKPKWVMLFTLLVSLPTFAFVYKFKQASADGRLLIWKVSTQMMVDKPWFGHGVDKFKAFYMNYQADYFKTNPDSLETKVADNVQYAFNELVKACTEKGVVGTVILLTVITLIILSINHKQSYQKVIIAGLIAVGGFSMFGYPSEILMIKAVVVVLLVSLCSLQAKSMLKIAQSRKNVFVLTSLGLLLTSLTAYKSVPSLKQTYMAYVSWKDASDIYNVSAYPESIEDFKQAYPINKNNGEFLIQYGKALEMNKDYAEAQTILQQAKVDLNNTILYSTLGNVYKELAQVAEAEKMYDKASEMCPSRLYPLYLLVKLYDENNLNHKALDMANRILTKEEKVPSKAVTEIKEEATIIKNKYESSSINIKPKGKKQEASMRKQTTPCLTPLSNAMKGGVATKIIICF